MSENINKVKILFGCGFLKVKSSGETILILELILNNERIECELSEVSINELYELFHLWKKIKETREIEKQ